MAILGKGSMRNKEKVRIRPLLASNVSLPSFIMELVLIMIDRPDSSYHKLKLLLVRWLMSHLEWLRGRQLHFEQCALTWTVDQWWPPLEWRSFIRGFLCRLNDWVLQTQWNDKNIQVVNVSLHWVVCQARSHRARIGSTQSDTCTDCQITCCHTVGHLFDAPFLINRRTNSENDVIPSMRTSTRIYTWKSLLMHRRLKHICE